jgi:hypothetical protein
MLFGRPALRNICLALSLVSPALVWADPLAGGPLDHLGSHVRGATPKIKTLIDEGIRRSPTFKALVDRINRSDVVVYISVSRDLPVGLEGRLSFMASAGSVRYLHAQVLDGLGVDGTIAIAAHELQHAVEVAEHPSVKDIHALATLYQRIGERSSAAHNRYDTAAARSTGRRVRQELS